MDFLSRVQAAEKAIGQANADMLFGMAILISGGRFFNSSTLAEIDIVIEAFRQKAAELGMPADQGIQFVLAALEFQKQEIEERKASSKAFHKAFDEGKIVF